MVKEWVEYWRKQNEGNDLKLFCQSCCYRYPEICIFMEELHPYDTFAEECPDYIPKDIYKNIGNAKCWKKRLELDPEYKPLPENSLPYFKEKTWEKVHQSIKEHNIELKQRD